MEQPVALDIHRNTQPHTHRVRTSGSRNEGSSFDSKLQTTKNHTCAGGSVWISSLVNALLEINQREDIKSNSGALCLLLRLLIDNNILRTLAAIPSHLPRSDKVAGCLCVHVRNYKMVELMKLGVGRRPRAVQVIKTQSLYKTTCTHKLSRQKT